MADGDPRFRFDILPDGPWRVVAPGVRRKDIAEDVYLLRLAAGASETEPVGEKVAHRFVIEGDLRVGARRLRAGENHRADFPILAEPRRSDRGCLVLVVLAGS